jgi:hypothetical protein
MIIKVEKGREADILEYQCAVFELECHMFTMENNPLLLQAEVLHADGGELDAATAWLLCKSVDTRLERLENKTVL